MTKNRLTGLFLIIALCAIVSGSISHAQDDILQDSGGYGKRYILQLSGKVLDKQFTDARASLEIDQPIETSSNQYMVVIRGFPKQNSRNSFYWHSDAGEMQVIPNEIVCKLKRAYLHPVRRDFQAQFFYLSPTLIKPTKGLAISALGGSAVLKQTEKLTLPTVVSAQAGQLKIRFSGETVSGSVWMKGYDRIEHSYVEYDASFRGTLATRLDPTWQTREPRREIR